MLEEPVRAGARQPVDELPRGVEERHHGVEVAVGPGAALAPLQGHGPPPLGHGEPLPDRPQDALRGDARRPRAHPVDLDDPGGVQPPGQGGRQPPDGRPLIAEGCRVPGLEQDRREQLVAGPSPTGVQLLASQEAP